MRGFAFLRYVTLMACAFFVSFAASAGLSNAAPKVDAKTLSRMEKGGCAGAYGAPAFVQTAKQLIPTNDPVKTLESVFKTRISFGPDDLKITKSGSIRVRYPGGSSSPTAPNSPLGGLGFYTSLSKSAHVEKMCLRYEVRFDDDFQFVQGGKLPGLFGGKAPSGGARPHGDDGFSLRLMWRSKGKGELYLYAPNMDPSSRKGGMSLGRGAWTFKRGHWTQVQLEVTLNEPGKNDGSARLWIDGTPALAIAKIRYRDKKDFAKKGLMFSTFFGGTGAKYAPDKTQHANFRNFSLYVDDANAK